MKRLELDEMRMVDAGKFYFGGSPGWLYDGAKFYGFFDTSTEGEGIQLGFIVLGEGCMKFLCYVMFLGSLVSM